MPPQYLNDLYMKKNASLSNEFLKNIHSYNPLFLFASMGGKINHGINKDEGHYMFRLFGQNIHRLGSLLSVDGDSYDTDYEVQNKINVLSSRNDRDLV